LEDVKSLSKTLVFFCNSFWLPISW